MIRAFFDKLLLILLHLGVILSTAWGVRRFFYMEWPFAIAAASVTWAVFGLVEIVVRRRVGKGLHDRAK